MILKKKKLLSKRFTIWKLRWISKISGFSNLKSWDINSCLKLELNNAMEPILRAKVKIFSKVKILKNAFNKK